MVVGVVWCLCVKIVVVLCIEGDMCGVICGVLFFDFDGDG